MKSELDDKSLEAAIRRAVGSEDARFDAGSWKVKYPEEVSLLESQKSTTATRARRRWRIRRIVMGFPSFKIAASAAVVAGVAAAVVIAIFASGGSTVAFAAVLDQLQTKSYEFQMDVLRPDGTTASVKCMVLEPGKMRLELHDGARAVVSVLDSNAGKALILLEQSKSARRVDKPESKQLGAAGFLVLPGRSIENLWNLRSGGETSLGKKEISGRSAEGFRVTEKHDGATETITVWADTETLIPITVEASCQLDSQPQPSQQLTLKDFKVLSNPDPALFSTDIPEGYTLANNQTLTAQDASAPAESAPSPEAKKVLQAFALWNSESKKEALDLLLTVDWNADFQFAPKDYTFTMTERQVISLVSADQTMVLDEVMKQLSQSRAIARELVAIGRQARTWKDAAKPADAYFNAAAGLGQLLDRNDDMMLIVRLCGIAVQKMALKELLLLYEESGDAARLTTVRERLKRLDEEQAAIKKSVAR